LAQLALHNRRQIEVQASADADLADLTPPTGPFSMILGLLAAIALTALAWFSATPEDLFE
jgi:hypothetical protein